ncbi:MAG TPA: GreA/GreB family elongation factor [Thermoanaerobaculia bacterium]|nr:GreA/GreB family elongation factor [Thermoanaerobaculia bacterium]
MTISRTIQAHLAKGDFAAVESDWLAQLGEAPTDLDYFVGVARALVGTAEEERARFLLEMLDEQLKEQARWDVRLKLLERIGAVLFPPEKLHPEILTSLDRLYAKRPTYKGLREAVGLTKAIHDIPKTWEKVERLQGLLQFDVGAIVWMQGRGAGRVVEANLGLESFKVDFERFPGLTVGFKAAPKLLLSLDKGHVLRRKIEEPQVLAALSPSELLRVTLQSTAKPMTAGEIREALYGLVSESGWTAWWGAARKHPQVVTSGGPGGAGRQTYTWAESSGSALDSVWRTFAKVPPRKKIDLLKKDGARDPDLRRRMAAELLKLGETAADDDPGLAFEIWFALERSGDVPDGLPWAPDVLLAEAADPVRLLSGVEERLLRERGYTMLREHRKDWAGVYMGLLAQEADPRAIEVLVDGLGKGAPRDFERFLDGLVSAPHRHPAAFVWLAERAASDETLRARSPLRLLQQILGSLNRDEFAPYRQRLVTLAESGGTVPRLLTHLTEEQAAQADDAVHRASGLEPFQRDQLTNALELRFSTLRRENQHALYATAESVDAKSAELHQIMTVDVPANRKAIEEARAMGDLRENFEYKSARARHEYLNARAAALNGELQRVRLIEIAGTDLSEVRIGTRVRLEGPARQRTITILGPWESRPEDDVLSYESDLAKQILGKRLGGEVEIGGLAYKVAAIEPYR